MPRPAGWELDAPAPLASPGSRSAPRSCSPWPCPPPARRRSRSRLSPERPTRPGDPDQHPRDPRFERRIGHRHRARSAALTSGTSSPTSAARVPASFPNCPSPKARKCTSWCTSKKARRWKTPSRSRTSARPKDSYTTPAKSPKNSEHFVTQPELRPPKVTVTTADPSLEGDIFTDPIPAPLIHPGEKKLLEFEPVGPNGLMILNPEGKLLWWNSSKKKSASVFEPVTYEGKTALAWWQGKVTEAAYGLGEGVIANTSYEPVAHIKAANGLHADIHELYITPEGQAYIIAVRARLHAGMQRRTRARAGRRNPGDRHQNRPCDVELARTGPRAPQLHRSRRRREACSTPTT